MFVFYVWNKGNLSFCDLKSDELYLKSFYLLKSINYHSDDRRHVEDYVQQCFQQSFDCVDNLEA